MTDTRAVRILLRSLALAGLATQPAPAQPARQPSGSDTWPAVGILANSATGTVGCRKFGEFRD